MILHVLCKEPRVGCEGGAVGYRVLVLLGYVKQHVRQRQQVSVPRNEV
jgi:hypothetical protein